LLLKNDPQAAVNSERQPLVVALWSDDLAPELDPKQTDPGDSSLFAVAGADTRRAVCLSPITTGPACQGSLVGLCDDVGLLAEEYDTGAQRLVGNFPQAFSHIALVNTAHNIADATKPCEQRSGNARLAEAAE
jgi:hypothetical protein